jgi:outer membrane protein W
MKNRIIILLSILACVGNMQAQQLYFKAGGSLALGWPWTYSSNESYHELIMSLTGTEVTSKNANFGLGASPFISAGYMFNQNIGAELGVGYQFGITRTNENTLINPLTYKTYRADTHLKCSWMWINPQLVIATTVSDFKPYGRAGVVVGFSPKMEMLTENLNDEGTKKTELTGGMPWGMNAALGINYNLCKNFLMFGELEMLQMNYAPTNSEVTEYTDANGNDILSTLSEKSKKTEFVDSWNSADLATTLPNKAAKINLPLSSFKINLGIRYNF